MPNEDLILSKIDNLTDMVEHYNKTVHKRIDEDNIRHKESLASIKEDNIKPVKESITRVYIWLTLVVGGFIGAYFKNA